MDSSGGKDTGSVEGVEDILDDVCSLTPESACNAHSRVEIPATRVESTIELSDGRQTPTELSQREPVYSLDPKRM